MHIRCHLGRVEFCGLGGGRGRRIGGRHWFHSDLTSASQVELKTDTAVTLNWKRHDTKTALRPPCLHPSYQPNSLYSTTASSVCPGNAHTTARSSERACSSAPHTTLIKRKQKRRLKTNPNERILCRYHCLAKHRMLKVPCDRFYSLFLALLSC